MTAIQALTAFWNGFTWKAYDETSVPDSAQLPYITFEGSLDNFGNEVAVTASLWDRSTSWKSVTDKEAEIADYITRGGRMIAFDGGVFWIKRQSPWAQRMSESSDENIRRIVLNLSIEFVI